MKTNKFLVFIGRLPEPGKRFFWLCLLIIIKFLLLAFLLSQGRPTTIQNSIAACSGDCDSYLTPIDHLIESGSYEPDYRMPGYGSVYYIFHLFFQKNIAANLVVIFQTLLDAIAALALAITLFSLTGKKSGFYLSMFFYGIGVTVSCYNNFILTESLTSSVLIFAFYFLVRFFKTSRNDFVFLAGLFFTWAYFLRPVNILLILIPITVIIIFTRESRFKKLIFFLIPVFVIQSVWTIRNYQLKNKIFLLTENTYMSLYTPFNLHIWDFCKTFSDFRMTTCFFDTSGMTYFGQSVNQLKVEEIKIPEEIYTEDFNLDSLLRLRSMISEISSPETDAEKKKYLNNEVIEKFTLYEKSVRKHHPFIVYVKTPVTLTASFLIQSGVHNLFFYPFSYLNIFEKITKLFFVFIYVTAFILFLVALFIYPKYIIDNKMILVSFAIAFYLIFIHSIVLRNIELRYIIPTYPFIVTGAVFCLTRLIDKFNKQ